jgi:hypothetical protein
MSHKVGYKLAKDIAEKGFSLDLIDVHKENHKDIQVFVNVKKKFIQFNESVVFFEREENVQNAMFFHTTQKFPGNSISLFESREINFRKVFILGNNPPKLKKASEMGVFYLNPKTCDLYISSDSLVEVELRNNKWTNKDDNFVPDDVLHFDLFDKVLQKDPKLGRAPLNQNDGEYDGIPRGRIELFEGKLFLCGDPAIINNKAVVSRILGAFRLSVDSNNLNLSSNEHYPYKTPIPEPKAKPKIIYV